MKYDPLLINLKNVLPNAQNILIALPSASDIDKLAAGLSLFLVLEAVGKKVTIVCDDTVKVSQSHLFGIDHVKNSIPATTAGNLVLTLEGVASVNGTIPALEKLDWFAENNNLNLVFHVIPGQAFQPVRITPKYQTGAFDVIFPIGATSLQSLGMIYNSNPQAFANSHIVNIDNQIVNANFGQTNIVDTASISISEITANLISDLGYVINADDATNLLIGIFDVTKNLTDIRVSAETYQVVANCLKMGGRKPDAESVQTQVSNPVFNSQFFQAQTGQQPDMSAMIPQNQPAFTASDFTVPPVIDNNSQTPINNSAANTPSFEERPAGEGVVSETVEPDWLTPKIFKGSSLG